MTEAFDAFVDRKISERKAAFAEAIKDAATIGKFTKNKAKFLGWTAPKAVLWTAPKATLNYGVVKPVKFGLWTVPKTTLNYGVVKPVSFLGRNLVKKPASFVGRNFVMKPLRFGKYVVDVLFNPGSDRFWAYGKKPSSKS